MNDCLFCKIITDEIPAEKIYEDENTLAFLDINPINPGHALVIPKEHSRNILDITSKSFSHVAETIRKISPAIKDAVGADGVNIHINNEPEAGQVVFHMHAHIIPRFSNDGIKMWQGKEYDENEAKNIAEGIKNSLDF